MPAIAPSDQDISVTERLEQTAEVVGIPLIDHIVVGIDKAIRIQEWQSRNRRQGLRNGPMVLSRFGWAPSGSSSNQADWGNRIDAPPAGLIS